MAKSECLKAWIASRNSTVPQPGLAFELGKQQALNGRMLYRSNCNNDGEREAWEAGYKSIRLDEADETTEVTKELEVTRE